jgi:hypothetical protein
MSLDDQRTVIVPAGFVRDQSDDDDDVAAADGSMDVNEIPSLTTIRLTMSLGGKGCGLLCISRQQKKRGFFLVRLTSR